MKKLTKEKYNELLKFYGTFEAIQKKFNIHKNDLTDDKITEIFEIHCKENSVEIETEELFQNYNNNLLFVDTPDGFQKINKLYKKSSRQIHKIATKNKNKILCSHDHLIESKTGWIYAKDLLLGDEINTENGYDSIVDNEVVDNSIVYDFEVDHENHRYWAGGISSHNTGKTHLIRSLINQLSKDKYFIYLPSSLTSELNKPDFVDFLFETTEKIDNKNIVLILEDAESLLVKRDAYTTEGISNILNVTDGILNDLLRFQIIATFNIDLIELDDALLRSGRLLARKEFKKLSIENAQKLIKHLGLEYKVEEEMSLAEIYSIKNKTEILEHDITEEIEKSFGFKV